MTKPLTLTPRFRQHPNHDIRDQIVKAAAEYFGRYGYEKTTVSDLAGAIGFAKAYIYKFFDSKQAIAQVICSHTLGAIMAAVDESIANLPSASEQLRCMFKTVVEAGSHLFFHERKLYAIAATSAGESWPSMVAYE